MNSAPWWQTAVVYQIYPRSFQDTTGDGVGDLRGITRRLDYLAGTLGVDAVWISPFYPSPMADFGYDVADYCDVDPRFGTLADFDALREAAHRRGLKVIVDWVPNHTSERHPWFVESRAARTSPRRDWYVWADAAPDGGPPNNWQSVFGGPAWAWDEATGQYYLHSFLEEQPDLNWRNPEVEAAMFDTVRFWMDRGVDGLRIDVAHFIGKDPGLRDNPPAPPPEGEAAFKDLAGYDTQLHLHDKGHPFAREVFRRLRALVDGYEPERFLVGEIHEFDPAKWAAYYGEQLDGLHMPYNFSLIWAPWEAGAFRRRVDAVEAALPAGAWPNHVLGNHDETRLVGRFGPAAARVASMLLLTLRGTPTMYYGDEIGMPQVEVPPEVARDPWGLRVPGLGRDGCRTPMQWAPGPGRGFTEPGVEPWLPFAPDAAAADVETQLSDGRSMLELTRRLLALRRESAALRLGSYAAIDGEPAGVFGYGRALGDERVEVYLNFTTDPVQIGAAGRVALSTHLDREGIEQAPMRLRPDEGVVVRPA